MKKYIYYIMAVTMIGMGTACSEDFIDKTPDLKVTEASIFESATRLEAAVEGVYTSLKGSDDVSDGYFLGGFATLAGDNRTDDMINYGNNGYTMRDTYSHSVNASSIENDALFRNAYLAINYANTIIDGIEKTYADNLPCDTETARRYVQECKFVRAIAYYYLSQLYGLPYKTDPNASNVPLRIEAVTGAGHNDCPASTISEVFNQILSDTEEIDALPENYESAGFSSTKASQASAHALRMRIYMCMEDWDNAIAEGNAISGFSLIPSIATMFDSPYALTAENIFSIPMSESDKRTNFLYTDERGYMYCEKYNERSTRYEWIPVFRYAEILLNLAECYYNTGNESKAIECVKQVRTRSISEDKDPLVTYKETGDALWTVIDNERRWEFMAEGIRGYDISRRAEDYHHPLTDGSWTVVATPSDKTTYCWSFPLYETTVNTALSE